MKKFLSLLLAVTMLLSLTAVGASAEAAPLVYWSMWSSTEPQAIAIQQVIDTYTAETGVKVNVEWKGRDVKTIIETAIDAGEQVDLFDTDFQLLSQQMGGKLMDLEEMAKAVEYDSFAVAALPAAVREWAGTLKCIPYQAYTSGIFYNKAIFEEVGIEKEPATWTELMDVCAKIKAAGYAPFAQDDAYVRYTFGFLMARHIGQNGVKDLVAKGDWAENPAALASASAIEEMVKLGYFEENVPGTFPASEYEIGFGTTAMIVNASWVYNEIVLGTENKDLVLGMFNFPTVEGGTDPATVANVGAQAFAIPATSKNGQAAFDLIMRLTSGEGDQLVATQSVGIPSDTRNTEWPESLAGCRDAFNALTQKQKDAFPTAE
ncbi:MAG: ABC transporter substrate-binding protein, partial [Clostridia bacterium]